VSRKSLKQSNKCNNCLLLIISNFHACRQYADRFNKINNWLIHQRISTSIAGIFNVIEQRELFFNSVMDEINRAEIELDRVQAKQKSGLSGIDTHTHTHCTEVSM